MGGCPSFFSNVFMCIEFLMFTQVFFYIDMTILGYKNLKFFSHKCNCDSGESTEDVGINANIQLLPILQLFIGGGTKSESMANVSIGPLECTGKRKIKCFNSKF